MEMECKVPWTRTVGPARAGHQQCEQEVPQALAESDAVRYRFLQEQGKLPKMKAIKADATVKKM